MLLAFMLAALTLTNRIQGWHLFVLASLLGVNYAFYVPAQSAFVVDMGGKEDLMNAIALNSSMVNGACIKRDGLGGLKLQEQCVPALAHGSIFG